MRTSQERIREMHKRAGELQRRAGRLQLAGLGGLSGMLTVLLAVVLVRIDGLSRAFDSDMLTGSSLLSDSAGGYALTAVLAFFAGVIITVAIIRYRNSKR